jgi:hypothetical protein
MTLAISNWIGSNFYFSAKFIRVDINECEHVYIHIKLFFDLFERIDAFLSFLAASFVFSSSQKNIVHDMLKVKVSLPCVIRIPFCSGVCTSC